MSFLWASVGLISILISVNSSTCSYSRVEDVCSLGINRNLVQEESVKKQKKQKKRHGVIRLYRFRYMIPD